MKSKIRQGAKGERQGARSVAANAGKSGSHKDQRGRREKQKSEET